MVEVMEIAMGNLHSSQGTVLAPFDFPTRCRPSASFEDTKLEPTVERASNASPTGELAQITSYVGGADSEEKTPKRTGRAIHTPESLEATSTSRPVPWAFLSPGTGGQVSDEMRSKFLHELQSRGDALSKEEALLAILECGASVASANPRDAAAFFCLHSLFFYLLRKESADLLPTLEHGHNGVNDLIAYSRRCLMRCLTLCSQGTSVGMAGWLEYGESDPVVRLSRGPANILHRIAGSYAREQKWNEAQAVLSTLLLKNERELPSHHPLVVVSLLHLAAVARINDDSLFMSTLVESATNRVFQFLVEIETSFMSYLHSCSWHESDSKPVFRIEDGPTALEALRRFVGTFNESVKGETFLCLEQHNPVVIVKHCLLGDSMAVLANCQASARVHLGSKSTLDSASSEQHYWKLAFANYRMAFTGLSEIRGFDDPRVCSAAYGMARCLRELGQHQKALELLTTVVAAMQVAPSHVHSKIDVNPLHRFDEKHAIKTPFLSRVLQARHQESQPVVQHHITVALCLWLMSVLSIDSSPNEQGRSRAFALLHAASVSLKLAMAELDSDGGVLRSTCMDMLKKVEVEAQKISKPRNRRLD